MIIIFAVQLCPDGGIGRRSGLKILCPLGRGGSSPPPGTFMGNLSKITHFFNNFTNLNS